MSEAYDLTVHGTLVLEGGALLENAWLGIIDGIIKTVSARPLDGTRHVEAGANLVMPGFIDAHVHTRSSTDEGITATTRAAAAGGTTTIIDMPFDRPARPVRSVEAFQRKVADIENEAVVDVALYATFPPTGTLDMIEALAKAGACGFKVSTIEVDANRFPRIPDGQLLEGFKEVARFNVPVAAHQENQDIIVSAVREAQGRGESRGRAHARSRPPVAEAEAAARLIEFAYWTSARLHMVHGTIPRTFDLINWNRSRGVHVTGETCIQYLTLTEDLLEKLGGRAKCNPPLRSRSDLEVLWDQLSQGKIDIVTSDHSPYPLHLKETTSIFDAYAGLPGAETLTTLLYSSGVVKNRIDLRTFIRVLAEKPAEIFGLKQKGRLSVGCDADFVLFDPASEWTIDENNLIHHMGWSPYHGSPVQGRVQATFVRGTCVYKDHSIVAMPGTGRFVNPITK